MAKKEFKIGEVFQCGLVKLKCVKAKDEKHPCCGCILDTCNCLKFEEFVGPCQDCIREDKTNVIFIKVND